MEEERNPSGSKHRSADPLPSSFSPSHSHNLREGRNRGPGISTVAGTFRTLRSSCGRVGDFGKRSCRTGRKGGMDFRGACPGIGSRARGAVWVYLCGTGAVTLRLRAAGGCRCVAEVPRRYRRACSSTCCDPPVLATPLDRADRIRIIALEAKFVLTGENTATSTSPKPHRDEKGILVPEDLDRVPQRVQCTGAA